MTPPKPFTEQRITFEMATRDDVLDRMVPSDLRKLVLERDRAEEELAQWQLGEVELASTKAARRMAADTVVKLAGKVALLKQTKAAFLLERGNVDLLEAELEQRAVEVSESARLLRTVQSWGWPCLFCDGAVYHEADCKFAAWVAQHPATDESEALSLRERLAAYAHESWTGWMEWMLPKLAGESEYWLHRWKRQMATPYADLSEKEKDSDRDEADKMLAIMRGEPLRDGAPAEGGRDD